MDRPSRRPFLANTGLVLASLVFFFVAAELFLRAFLGDASLWHYPNYIVEAFADYPASPASSRSRRCGANSADTSQTRGCASFMDATPRIADRRRSRPPPH